MVVETDDIVSVMRNITPVDDLYLAVFIFRERGTTFHPVATVVIHDAVQQLFLGVMNMATNNTVDFTLERFLDDGMFKVKDETDRTFYLVLDCFRQRTIRQLE